MTKAELVLALANQAEVSKKDAENVLNAFVDIVIETVKNNDKIQLIGFGTFEQKVRPARQGVNPRTGEKIVIKASKSPVFRVGKAFKDAME